MIRAIFFDFDGVILESVDAKTRAFEEMYLPYGPEVVQQVVAHHEKNGGISRFEKFKHYHLNFLNQDLSEASLKEMGQRFSDIALQKVLRSPFVEGAMDFLTAHHEKYDFWVISGTPTDELRYICRERGLDQYFKGIFGSPESKTTWGKKILSENSYSERDVLFVGDALTDYTASIDLNTHFFLRKTPINAQYFANYRGLGSEDLSNLESTIRGI